MSPLYSGCLKPPSPSKQPAQSPGRPPAAQTHSSCHLKGTHQKAFFQRNPSRRPRLKQQRQKLLQLARGFEGSRGLATNRSFPWGTHFFCLPHRFLPRTALCAAQAGLWSLAKHSPDKLPANWASALLLSSLLYPRAVLEGTGCWTPDANRVTTNTSGHPSSICWAQTTLNLLSPLPSITVSTESPQGQHRLFWWGDSIVLLFPPWCKCHFFTWVIRLWIDCFFPSQPLLISLHPILALITENNKSS